MKLQPDKPDVQTVTAHGPGWLAVNGERIESSTVISSFGDRFPWDCGSFEQLDETHFARLSGLEAELVIFGSGRRLRFPRPVWLAPLMKLRIGVETMDTAAACRTYNILAAEGRRVVAALLIE